MPWKWYELVKRGSPPVRRKKNASVHASSSTVCRDSRVLVKGRGNFAHNMSMKLSIIVPDAPTICPGRSKNCNLPSLHSGRLKTPILLRLFLCHPRLFDVAEPSPNIPGAPSPASQSPDEPVTSPLASVDTSEPPTSAGNGAGDV